MTTSSDPTETAVIGGDKTPAWGEELAQDLTRFHISKYGCPRCWVDQLCDFHRGYVEGARAMSYEVDR